MAEEHYTRLHPFSRIPVIHPALLYDNGEGRFTWKSSGTGLDWTAAHNPIAAHVGTNGILLKTRQTGPSAADLVKITRKLWLPPQKVVRLQVSFNTTAADPEAVLWILIAWHDGTLRHYAGVLFRSLTGAVAYVSGFDGADLEWTWPPDWEYVYEGAGWNKLDLSVNIRALKYHLIHVNEHVLDASAIPLSEVPGAVGKHLYIEFCRQTGVNTQAVAYLDEILLTPENP